MNRVMKEDARIVGHTFIQMAQKIIAQELYRKCLMILIRAKQINAGGGEEQEKGISEKGVTEQ